MAITWSSSNTDVIAEDGTVTRPLGSDESVVLTATFSSAPNGTYTCVHQFVFVVLAAENKDFTVTVENADGIPATVLTGESTDINVTVSNPQNEVKTVNVYVAVYDENDVLVSCYIPVSETVSESKDLTGSVQLSQEVAGKAKTVELFVWNDALQPYDM